MTVGHPASQKFKRGDYVTHKYSLGSRWIVVSVVDDYGVYVWDGKKKFFCESKYLQKPLDKWR